MIHESNTHLPVHAPGFIPEMGVAPAAGGSCVSCAGESGSTSPGHVPGRFSLGEFGVASPGSDADESIEEIVRGGLLKAVGALDQTTASRISVESASVDVRPSGVRLSIPTAHGFFNAAISPRGRRITVWQEGGLALSANVGASVVLSLGEQARVDRDGVPRVTGEYHDLTGVVPSWLRGVVLSPDGPPVLGKGKGGKAKRGSRDWWGGKIDDVDPDMDQGARERIICLMLCLSSVMGIPPILFCISLLVTCFTSAGWLIPPCIGAAACLIVGLIVLILCWIECS